MIKADILSKLFTYTSIYITACCSILAITLNTHRSDLLCVVKCTVKVVSIIIITFDSINQCHTLRANINMQ